MGTDEELERATLEAALETRRELGTRYEAELVGGFAERIERTVERRVADELAQRRRTESAVSAASIRQMVLGIVSLAACIPITIVLGLNGEAFALLVALAAIVAVNWAHATTVRRARER